MDKFHQLKKAQNLISQAMQAALASMPNNDTVAEARGHMRQAIAKLEKASKTQTRKQAMNAKQFETWWGNVQSGTAHVAAAPMTAEQQKQAMDRLNAMAAEELKKIEDLEQEQVPNNLINE